MAALGESTASYNSISNCHTQLIGPCSQSGMPGEFKKRQRGSAKINLIASNRRRRQVSRRTPVGYIVVLIDSVAAQSQPSLELPVLVDRGAARKQRHPVAERLAECR